MSESRALSVEPPITGRTREYPFEYFATAIGYLCKECAVYETHLYILIRYFLNVEQIKADVVFHSTSGSMADLCDLMIKLAYAAKAPQSIVEEADQNVKMMKNNIGPKRNRYVHDLWVGSDNTGEGIHGQIKVQSVIEKTQSFQPKKLLTRQLNEHTLQEIWDCVTYTKYLGSDLMSIYMELTGSPDNSSHPRPRGKPFVEHIGGPALPYSQNGSPTRY